VVAQDEWFGASMITIDVVRHGLVALDTDEVRARFVAAGQLTLSQSSKTPVPSSGAVRVLVEVQRRFGGHSPRALLGARYEPGEGGVTTFGVGFGVIAVDNETACPSRLNKRPYLPGLPEEFSAAVLDGLAQELADLPAGTVVVDRAGFDEVESSTFVFRQAAQVLRCAFAAKLCPAVDVEVEVRALVETW
jgi:hypothetical protein